MGKAKKKIYTFKPDEDRFLEKAIKNNNKNIGSDSSKKQTSKIDRKKRTEKFLYHLSKTHSQQELEQIRFIMESVSDEEFEMLCNQADMLTNMMLGDDHNFNVD